MNNKDELQVKPVKRYRKPKYPSHEDPDPTLHPQPIPYPASRKLISALATSAGMVVTASCAPPTGLPLAEASSGEGNTTETTNTAGSNNTASGDFESATPDAVPIVEAGAASDDPVDTQKATDEENGPTGDDVVVTEIVELIQQLEDNPFDVSLVQQAAANQTAQELIDKAGGNPLCVALSGLPHQTSGFGTGMPNYIQADLARRVIERVFKNAGYQLKRNQQYDRDGVAMVLDGYDEQKKVGFVVGDWKNLDNDAVLLWWAPPSQVDGKKYEAEINTLVQSIGNNPEHKQLLSDVQAAKKQADPARRSAAYKAILTKHRKSLLSLKEMIELEKRGKQGEEFIAVISTYDTRFALPMFSYITPSEQAEINKIADPGKRNAATKALTEQKAKAGVEALEKAAREYIQWAQRQGLN